MSSEQKPPTPARRWGRRKKVVVLVVGLLLVWAVGAYILVPGMWKRYTHRHPALEDLPGRAYTADGIPADPINVALVGTKAEVMKIMLAAKWYPADPLTLRSCLEIAEASVLKRPYEEAPVSSEYLFGRKQDLAFEQAVARARDIATTSASGCPRRWTPTAAPSGWGPRSTTSAWASAIRPAR